MRLNPRGKMPDDNPNPPPIKEPETFSRDYVKELREENKGLRLKAIEMQQRAEKAEKTAETAEAQIAAAKAEAEAAIKKVSDEAEAKVAEATTAATTAANERVIQAELRTAATAAGMRDLDGLKLADLSSVKLNDKGEVEGADALLAALKEGKPYLFGEPPKSTTTNVSTQTPKPADTVTKKASEMTEDEYRAALKSIDAGKGMPT
jgi:uncharacterized membrane protein YqiK